MWFSEIAGVLYRSCGIKETTKYDDAILSYHMEVLSVTSEIVRKAATYAKEFNAELRGKYRRASLTPLSYKGSNAS